MVGGGIWLQCCWLIWSSVMRAVGVYWRVCCRRLRVSNLVTCVKLQSSRVLSCRVLKLGKLGKRGFGFRALGLEDGVSAYSSCFLFEQGLSRRQIGCQLWGAKPEVNRLACLQRLKYFHNHGLGFQHSITFRPFQPQIPRT